MAESYSECTPKAEETPLDPNSPNYTPPKNILQKNTLCYDSITPEKPRSLSSKSTISDYPKSYNEDLLFDYQKSTKNILFLISAIKKPRKNLIMLKRSWKIWQNSITKNNLTFAISSDSLFDTPSKCQFHGIPNLTFSTESMASLVINGKKTEKKETKIPKWKKSKRAQRKIRNAMSSAELRYFYKKKNLFNKYKKIVLDPRFVPAKKPIIRMRILALKSDMKIFAKCFRKHFLKFYNMCIKKTRVTIAVGKVLDAFEKGCENQRTGAFWHMLEISNRLKTKEIIKKRTMKNSVKLLDNAISYWVNYGKEMMMKRNFECGARFSDDMNRLCRKKLKKYFFSIVSQNLKPLKNVITELDKKLSLSRGKKFFNWKFQYSLQRHILKYKHHGASRIHKTIFSIQKRFLYLSLLFIQSSASRKKLTPQTFPETLAKSSILFYQDHKKLFILSALITIIIIIIIIIKLLS